MNTSSRLDRLQSAVRATDLDGTIEATPRASVLSDRASFLDDGDLGFTYLAVKNGTVFIRRHGQVASELRGAKAEAFLKKIGAASSSQAQQIMARVTGNYKRGNERSARAKQN